MADLMTQYRELNAKLFGIVQYYEDMTASLEQDMDDMNADFEECNLRKSEVEAAFRQLAEDSDKRIDDMMRKVRQLEIDLDAKKLQLLETEKEFKEYRSIHIEANDKLRGQLARQREFIKAIRPELAEHLTPCDYDRAVDLFGLSDPTDELPPFEIPEDFFGEGENDGN